MAKKSFQTAPKPKRQPSLDEIAQFEQNGPGSDKATQTIKTTNVVTNIPTNVEKRESTKRLSLDLPSDLHKRFKTACSATDTKMVSELVALIRFRTEQLEEEAGLSP